MRRAGLEETEAWPADGISGDGQLSCDSIGCLYRADDQVVALVSDPRALEEDCARADVIVSLVPVAQACHRAAVVIDRFDIWREGAHAIWLEEGTVRLESVVGERGERPWTLIRGFPDER